MKRRPEVGDRGEMRFVAATEHAIDFSDDTVPPVLSTSALILPDGAATMATAKIEGVRPCTASL